MRPPYYMPPVLRSLILLVMLSPALGFPLVLFCDQAPSAIVRYDTIHHPVIGRHGMVASQNNLASEVGVEILKRGGNAVDAAVAVGFALAVTLPRAGNLGGGGFMLISDAAGEDTLAIDYRESAPAAAHRDMFLDVNGDVDTRLEQFSHLSAGVPGTVAGLAHAWRQKGSLPWKNLLQPAINLASEGFTVSDDLASILEIKREPLTANPVSAALFFGDDGNPQQVGTVLKQPDLAKTLTLIAEHGHKGFYGGTVADLIVAEMKKNGGLITHQDLDQYRPKIRAPLIGQFNDFTVMTMPPPSSGGIHILQMAAIAQYLPIEKPGQGSAASIHYLAEIMKRAYADRSKHLGDPDFHEVPTRWLLSEEYARSLAASISETRATPSDQISAGTPPPPESPDTTHFSVIDQNGMTVSNTYTLNFSFGSGIMVEGAGFLLNNEMSDFSAKPGVPNAFNLLGGSANAIEPGKRPLSSMSPAIVFRNNQVYLATGSPGGSRIISTVFQQLVNILYYDMNVAAATSAPRFHHQWYPDVLELEPGFSPDTIARLEAMGHQVRSPAPTMGSLQSIVRIDGLLFGAADPRRPNALAVGY